MCLTAPSQYIYSVIASLQHFGFGARQPTHREYLVSWKGMGPGDREWLSEHKLKNAADLVQEYLQDLQASGRIAPCIGKASTDVPVGDNIPRQSGEAQSATTRNKSNAKRQADQPNNRLNKTLSQSLQLTSQQDVQLVCTASTETSVVHFCDLRFCN